MPRAASRVLSCPGIVLLCLECLAGAAASGEPWQQVGPTGVGMITGLARGKTALYAATCNGVYRSDDGASSWREIGPERLCISRLAVQPGDVDTLYAIVDNHTFTSQYPEPSYMVFPNLILGSTLLVSRDGGANWRPTPISNGHAVGVDATHPGTAYVAAYASAFGQLAVTHDAGVTWAAMDPPSSFAFSLAVDPADGTLLAAGGALNTYAAGSWSSLAVHVFVLAVGSGADGTVYAVGPDFCRKAAAETAWTCGASPTSNALSLVELPESGALPRRLMLLGYEGMWVSDDRGATWLQSRDDIGYAPAALADASGAAVYIGNDTGVFRSLDRGASWTNASAGLSSMWVRALALDPFDPSRIWAGGEGRLYDVYQLGPGLFRSDDEGGSWTSVTSPQGGGYVFSLAVDPSSRLNLLAGSFNRIDSTHDGGASWQTATGVGGLVLGIAVDPDVAGRVWSVGRDALRRSDDSGATWSQVLAKSMFSILFDDRGDPARLYAGGNWEDGGFYYPFGSGFSVQSSGDDGRTWTRSGGSTGAAATALSLDPFAPNAIYAGALDGSVLRSADAGATWENRNPLPDGSSVLALAADPIRPGHVYAGSWTGVYRSPDGGETWEPFWEGLSPLGAFALAVAPDGRWIYAGTNGGAVFRRNLSVSERNPPHRIGRPQTPRVVPRP